MVVKNIFMNWNAQGKHFQVKPNDFDNLGFQYFSLNKTSKSHYMKTPLFELIFSMNIFFR